MNRAVATTSQDLTRVNAAAEADADRADVLLRLWDIPVGADVAAMCEAAAGALRSGEARRLAESLAAPVPVRELGAIVGGLVASWPRENRDMAVMANFMAQDVARAAPSRAALLLACRYLRANHTHPPSIAEVLAALEASKKACASRAALLERLPRRVAELSKPKGD